MPKFISNFKMAILSSSSRHPWFRPYLVNLLPCLTRITKRQEETVQETLAAAMPKIMVALGHFANDGEIKVISGSGKTSHFCFKSRVWISSAVHCSESGTRMSNVKCFYWTKT